jgi:hypothetical protein
MRRFQEGRGRDGASAPLRIDEEAQWREGKSGEGRGGGGARRPWWEKRQPNVGDDPNGWVPPVSE